MHRVLCLIAPLALAACVSTGAPPSGGGSTGTGGDVARAATSGAPLDLVNAVRAQNGLSPLRQSRQLDRAAAAHAADMARNDYYGHTSPGGGTERTRMRAAGYDACSSRENIAWGQASDVVVTQAWISSSAHRANILNPKATDMGIAGARDPEGPRDPLWVMLIGAESC